MLVSGLFTPVVDWVVQTRTLPSVGMSQNVSQKAFLLFVKEACQQTRNIQTLLTDMATRKEASQRMTQLHGREPLLIGPPP
jgi:hypothetical protein